MDGAGGPAPGGHEGDTFERLLGFLNRLDQRHVHYGVSHTRPDSVMVDIALPGQRWEVEFMRDGTIEIERYQSMADVEDNAALLNEMLADIDRPIG